ncbi:MAG TPA: 4Fe-4S binding protein [candidate division Zixibacteria bacterium]|nr:4Fe-4S binding protein [candidate division Zixibacteria bacterium]MDD4918491.1 4Fe-4S binding protein [candidate division Zixibacteria bacterium]MDM7971818.1 4Fe-4S binding protein [candidate division Zixibacteria bacterium]HOD65928.1 4Fe-4S binding protein [candidate division Zixibacteria bacterium]HOZ08325.1 4Fe-4S binding protein [candidate division Zixibacteria bacterium]
MHRRLLPLTALFSVLCAAPLRAVEEHVEEVEPTVWDFLFTWHYMLFVVIAVIGMILVMNRLVNKWVRIGAMAAVFVLFGLDYLFPLHPSPMCGVVNLIMFRITTGMFFPIFVALALAMFVPSLVGRKLFCGWVCPLGALQELANKIPFKWKFKQFNFTAFNAVRLSLFVLFILTVFAVKNHVGLLAERLEADTSVGPWTAFSAYSVYDPINFFELLHWSVDATFIVMMAVLLLAGLVLYRPFCYGICPIGALTWLCEKIAPARVRIDREACTECMDCVAASPCPTIKQIVEGKVKVLADCTSCGECIKACEYNALSFGFTARRGKPVQP